MFRETILSSSLSDIFPHCTLRSLGFCGLFPIKIIFDNHNAFYNLILYFSTSMMAEPVASKEMLSAFWGV